MKNKKLTKLLNPSVRKSIISSVNPDVIGQMKMRAYARYLADTQIIQRSLEHKNDKDFGYGFSPINFVCAIHSDGTISKSLFEFNIINHFLKLQDGDSAVEVLMCILIDLVKNDKSIASFDPKTIDAELAKIEAEYIAEEKAKEESELSSSNDTTDKMS